MFRLEQQAPFAPHWNSYQYEALFATDAPSRIVLAAADEINKSEILGFLVSICLPDDWEIESVVVDEAARRHGVGSQLLRELILQAAGAGAPALILEVRESNVPARQLYEKHGFVQESQRVNYYQGPLEPALLYRLPLQSCDKIP
jgi:ribosomal-protein-alanine N-acetyltransferase